MQHLVLTFVGPDRPGFVKELAEIVKAHNGNWLESRMVGLGGKFAGLARVSVDGAHRDALVDGLNAASSDRFSLVIDETSEEHETDGRLWQLDVIGNDRPGIVHETTSALSDHDINVVEMSTDIAPASMSGTMTFNCKATVSISADLDTNAIEGRLAAIANNLGLDILLEPSES